MNALSKVGVCSLMVASIAVGIWINQTAWRNRRMVWQFQAAVIAGSVGFVAGRISR